MEDKKEKWEIQFENYKNGSLDKELEELKSKYDNKEIDIKTYMKEQKRFEKIKANLPKIEHLVELRVELKDLKKEIEKEFVNRENEKTSKTTENAMRKLDIENEALMINIDDAKKRLKDKNLSEKDRKDLEKKLSKDEEKLSKNNDKYLELNAKSKENSAPRQSQISKMSKQDLNKNYQKICMKLSRNNFYAKRLIKGYDIESVKKQDKEIDWTARKYDIDIKKLIAKGKEAEKMKALKETAKEEPIVDNLMEEQIGNDVKKILEERENNSDKEELAMVEVSEFEQKHPRLAKIRKFLSNIKNKIFNKEEKEDLQTEKKTDEKENIDKNEEKITNTPHKDFVKRLKDMSEYEISDVAEKGMDGIKAERMIEAKKRLLENKQKSAEASKAKYEQKFNEYYKNHNINKTKTDNTNYMDPSIKDEGR